MRLDAHNLGEVAVGLFRCNLVLSAAESRPELFVRIDPGTPRASWSAACSTCVRWCRRRRICACVCARVCWVWVCGGRAGQFTDRSQPFPREHSVSSAFEVALFFSNGDDFAPAQTWIFVPASRMKTSPSCRLLKSQVTSKHFTDDPTCARPTANRASLKCFEGCNSAGSVHVSSSSR